MNDYLRLTRSPYISLSAPTCSACAVDLEFDDGWLCPSCGMEPRLVYDESSLATVQAHHVAQATEAAVREQIAAQIEAQPPEYFSATMISKALAAEIARGRS